MSAASTAIWLLRHQGGVLLLLGVKLAPALLANDEGIRTVGFRNQEPLTFGLRLLLAATRTDHVSRFVIDHVPVELLLFLEDGSVDQGQAVVFVRQRGVSSAPCAGFA